MVDMERIARDERDPVARIRALLGLYIRSASDEPEMFKAAFLTVLRRDQLPDALPPSALVPFHAALADALREAQRTRGQSSTEPEADAQLIWGAVHGALAIGRNLPRFEFAEATARADATVEIMRAGLSARPRSPAH